MTRWIAALSLPLTLALGGCDSEPEAAQERIAQEEVDDSARHHGRRSPADRLCAKIECSDGQETALGELFAEHRPAKDDRKAHHEARRAEMKALGEAFASGSLTAEQLEAHHQGREKKMGELGRPGLFVEVHALLTPEQRAILADAIEHRGLHVLGGKGKRGSAPAPRSSSSARQLRSRAPGSAPASSSAGAATSTAR